MHDADPGLLLPSRLFIPVRLSGPKPVPVFREDDGATPGEEAIPNLITDDNPAVLAGAIPDPACGNDRNRLSIALATYNGERYLGEQLESILHQTRLPEELVIFDDASTDATPAIVQEFAKGAPFPVRFQINAERLGSTRNFEAAIRACSGDIIFLCDQDDVWYPEKIARMEERFIHDLEAGAVFTDADVVDQDLRPFGPRLWDTVRFKQKDRARFAAHDALSVLLKRPVVTGATMAFRSRYRDLILPMPEIWIHDAWISLLIGAVSHLVALPIPLIAYRQHSANQIGIPRRGRRGRRRRHRESFALMYSPVIRCFEELRERLLKFNGCFPESERHISRLEAKLVFLRARSRLPPKRWRRLPRALRELVSLRYHRYAKGIGSFLGDLWRR
jgi:glycosyltransferase involved in cell wall biosynthesis